MTKSTDDPIVSRRRLIAREVVLLPGDPSLRDVIALVPTGLYLLEVSIGVRGYHKERRAIDPSADFRHRQLSVK